MSTPCTHDITTHGAVGDGTTLNTRAIQGALDAASGGGVVLVPPGKFMTGTVFLRSNTVLELMPGATLLGSPRLSDYVRLTRGVIGDRTGYHLIVADGVQNVTIRGQGTIDGNGPSFWEPTLGPRLEEYPRHAPDPERGRLMWIRAPDAHSGRPSPMVELRFSQDVRVEGVHLTNSGGWTLHTLDCDRVWIRGVKLTSNLMGPNNDGMDITGCRDVMISDCDISCCDDAVCLKTYPNERPCERVTVTNCVIRTRCAAFKTGEAFGLFRQIAFSNSVVYECSRAVALYANDGCIVEDVAVSNIVCDTRGPLMMNRPIHIDARYSGLPDGSPAAGPASAPCCIRNVSISNVVCRTDGRILLTAEKGRMLENITLRDVHLIYPTMDDPDPIGAGIGGAQFSNRNPAARVARGAVVAENVSGLVVDGLRVDWPQVDGTGRVATPEEWRFALKAANGSMDLYERKLFNSDTVPDFAVLWGRNLQGGYIRAPLAHPPRPAVPRFDLRDSTIAQA
jgi:hypothetical protein